MKKSSSKTLAVPAPAYEDRAVQSYRAAGAAEAPIIIEAYAEFLKAAKNIKTNTVAAANHARELGIHLQTWCQHEQIDFQFWKDNGDGVLPFTFESAKMFTSIARKMESPATELSEAAPLVQSLLAAGGMLHLTERTAKHQASSVPPVQKFLAKATMIRADFKAALRQSPMEGWPESLHETFEDNTAWIAEARERSAAMRQQKFKK